MKTKTMKTLLLILLSAMVLPAWSQPQTDAAGADWVYLENPIPESEFIPFLNHSMGWTVYDSLGIISAATDELGWTHRKYQQFFRGLPLEGCEIIFHFQHGLVNKYNGKWISGLKDDTAHSGFDSSLAKSIALEKYRIQFSVPDSLMAICINKAQLVYTKPYLKPFMAEYFQACWKIQVADEFFSYAHQFYVNMKGEVLQDFPLTRNCTVASGQTVWNGSQSINTQYNSGVYRLKDDCQSAVLQTRNWNSGLRNKDITNSGTAWSAPQASITTHWALRKSYDYFKVFHSRTGFDGASGSVNAYNDAIISGSSYNASANYYGGSSGELLIGAGRGIWASDHFCATDVIGHEYAHLVAFTTAKFIYYGESGALDEAFSDIYGASTERYAENGTNIDFTIGEDISNFGIMRSMASPKSYSQPNTYNGQYWYNGNNDNGGVHTNSGVLNYVMYCMWAGASGTNDNGYKYNVTGIGVNNNATKIAYRAEVYYLTSQSTYADARSAFINAASDIYGNGSNQYNTTVEAWCAVGLGNTCSGSSGSTCNYSLSSTHESIPMAGGSAWFGVVTSNACNFQSATADNWIHITSGNTYLGSSTISYYAAANPAKFNRTGSIIISYTGGSLTFTVVQEGYDCTPNLLNNATSINYAAQTIATQNTQASGACPYGAGTAVSWIHYSSGSTSNGIRTDYWAVDQNNTGGIRQGVLLFDDGGGSNQQSYTVTQYPKPNTTYNVTYQEYPAGSGYLTGAGVYNEGDFVSLNAYPNPGYTFYSMQDGNNIYGPSLGFNIFSNKHIIVNFRPVTNGIANYPSDSLFVFPNPCAAGNSIRLNRKVTHAALIAADGDKFELQSQNGPDLRIPDNLPSGIYVLYVVDASATAYWLKVMVL